MTRSSSSPTGGRSTGAPGTAVAEVEASPDRRAPRRQRRTPPRGRPRPCPLQGPPPARTIRSHSGRQKDGFAARHGAARRRVGTTAPVRFAMSAPTDTLVAARDTTEITRQYGDQATKMIVSIASQSVVRLPWRYVPPVRISFWDGLEQLVDARGRRVKGKHCRSIAVDPSLFVCTSANCVRVSKEYHVIQCTVVVVPTAIAAQACAPVPNRRM